MTWALYEPDGELFMLLCIVTGRDGRHYVRLDCRNDYQRAVFEFDPLKDVPEACRPAMPAGQWVDEFLAAFTPDRTLCYYSALAG